MLANLQNIIIKVVKTAPGIGPGPVADAIGRDKSQARRAMRDLAARGYLIEQNNGHGYAYFPVSEKDMQQGDARSADDFFLLSFLRGHLYISTGPFRPESARHGIASTMA